MATFAGKTTISGTGTLTNTLDLGSSGSSESISLAVTWADGTGANQAKMQFGDTRSLSGSANEELDLSGTLTDAFGTTIAFTAIKALYIKAASTNGDTINVGGAASNAWDTAFGDATDVVKVRPGGMLALIAPDATGYAVTAGTGDLLKITNADSGTASYSILIQGETA